MSTLLRVGHICLHAYTEHDFCPVQKFLSICAQSCVVIAKETTTVKHLVLIPTLLLAPLAVVAADSKSEPASGAPAAFSRLKSLVGEWQADTPMGKARLTYELVASGTAVLEREAIGDMPPMITMYYLDGNRLLLTHYCMVGNQPRMQAQNYDPAARELKFQFVDATNLPSANAAHMHSATFRFVDDDHFKSAWDFYDGGKPKETHAAEYTRVR